ncbi:MAG: DEAD/DEAH box helicase [Treponema sp.]|nr:DEAD/DEAH box helicase [Treponema sp.]
MKNRYGVTPWGSWFIDVLDSYEMGSRLDRGRTYANTGKVLSLELDFDHSKRMGRAVAKVKGNYRPFYRVEIQFPPLEEAEEVYRMIEEDPPLLARIAAGELPESFLDKLIDRNIELIPSEWDEMERSCTCPDYGDPCKHMAALYYIIAAEIDADPHVLFRLRGMDLAERFGKAAVHSIEPPFTITFTENEKTGPQTNGEPAQEPDHASASLELEEIPNCTDLIIALLPPSPPFSGRDFAVVMAEFYHHWAHYRSWESAEAEINSQMEHPFSRSVWTVHCPNPAPDAQVFLDAADINGDVRRFTPHDAFDYFVNFSSEDGTASYSFLFYLFKFFNLVCGAGAFIPYVYAGEGTLKIIWRPFETLPLVFQMLEALGSLGDRAAREGGMLKAAILPNRNTRKTGKQRTGIQKTSNQKTGNQKTEYRTVSGRSVVDLLASAFLTKWVSRRALAFRGSMGRQAGGADYQELLNLFFYGTGIDVSSPARRSMPQNIDRWLSVLHIDFTAHNYNLTLKEIRSRNAVPASQALYFALSMDVIIEQDEGVKKIPLSKCKDINILLAPTALSNYLGEISSLTSRASVRLSEARLTAFLDSAAGLLTRLGITVTLPKSLARELRPRLMVKGNASGESLKRYLDLNTLTDFEWQVAIGGEVLTVAEFEKLVREKRSFVRFKDGFVRIDPEELSRLLKRAKEGEPDFNDFLRAHFSGDSVLAFDVRETIDNLFREQNLPIPLALNAVLRPYQKRGYNWICSLLLSGFGCVLADDMGLGKTVQSIAALLRLKEEGLLGNGCLVIAPASLLSNWEKELARFAPTLAVSRYHGSNRILNRDFDVFLTTYQTAARDVAKLKDVAFSMLLVDEAHLMKNTETRVSRTVKLLRSQYRLALSGTPVENRLEDLRSLFDFILPGYLGTASVFRELYRIPIEVMRSREQAEALRKITSPFMLRRLKTDKTIIKDLPEKIVTNEYAVLEKEQAVLYKSVVDESMEKSEKMEPKERSSLILSLLTSLKQICDHPRVFDKESPAASVLSGKAQLLLTLLAEILANREKTLVFSQYVETLDCLDRIIRKELGEAPLLYHGGLGQNLRSEIIDRFQNDPAARILLISLKAGGLGLNLTAASRVIHYDLWYNPAVENQATDRAFRIGQKHNVFVHRFITKNSFEEKIDAMLSSKQELADMTVKSGESWLARMSHEELRELFER